ncbi:MAG TPA: transposase [Ignavibacteriaceae bacterium]
MKNSNQTQRKSIRLKEYDYSFPGWYYVTICTKDFIPWFGKINNGKVEYNSLGNIAVKFFEEIPKHFKNTEIDEYIVMPNHVHGIIIINDVVGTRDRVSLRKFGSTDKCSLSIIMNQYKGSITRIAHKNGFDKFAWQPRFYEHIIRNDIDLQRIRTYIRNNPLKWELDVYNNT